MARIKINPLSSKEYDFIHDRNETLQQIFDRFWASLPSQDDRVKEYYIILLGGEKIHRDLWSVTTPQDQDVLISIHLAGGSSRPLFKQIIITAAVVAAMVLTKGAASPWVVYGVPAAVAIGSTLAVNALLPPILVGLDGLGNIGLGYEDSSSQSYNITGQSNQMKKYASVPKVYGSHRMFPTIVANPYIEVEADPNTGELVQYFHCIYDFGLGPNYVSDLKIGDTLVGDYFDATYRFVDPNRPDVDEGDWDKSLNKEFTLYRGVSSQENFTVALNKNQDDAGALPVEYQAVRNANENSDGLQQHISLILAFPRGLTTYGTNGSTSARTVEIDIEFAEVGTENWYSISDINHCYSWESNGYEGAATNITILNTGSVKLSETVNYYYPKFRQPRIAVSETWGLEKGGNTFYSEQAILANSIINHGNTYIGKISTVSDMGGGVYKYTIYETFPYNLPFTTVYKNYDLSWTLIGSSSTAPYNNVFKNTNVGTISHSKDIEALTYITASFRPKTTNNVKVRVTRLRSFGGYSYRVLDDMQWSALLTRFDDSPVITEKRHTFCEVKIKATDQLNGTLQNLSGVVNSVLHAWTGSAWELRQTNNPAWVFADLLTGEVNKRAVSLSKLDATSLLEWANYCDEYPSKHGGGTFDTKRYTCNFILDYKTTLSNILSRVSNSANAGINMYGGNYGVLVDKTKTVPVQVFTPRNTSNFSSVRNYADIPHALKMKYVDSFSDWGVKEKVVYSDGYDEDTAITFEEMDTFACTNDEQAWRYGRYMLAQGLLRQETIRIDVDFENLVCTRGDYVLFQHDVMRVGGTPARVKTVAGSQITIDSTFDGTVGGTYGYTFRGVSEIVTGTMTLDSTDSATLNSTVPAVGDLIIFGEVDSVTIDTIVKSIEPTDELSATLFLVERANAIHDAESGAPFPAYSPQISSSIELPPGEVGELTSEASYTCAGGDYRYYVSLTWYAPTDNVVETYEIYVDNGSGYELTGYSTKESFEYTISTSYIGQEHSFKVLGVSSTGAKISLGGVTPTTVTPESKTVSPSDVEDLYLNVTNEALQINWTRVTDCDLDYYMIRFSPSLTASWFSSIPLQNVDRGTTMTTVQARTGTYLIKAVDWNGNESDNAALAITSIPNLVGLNVIEETNDFPTLSGTMDQVTTFGSELVLQEKASGGGGGITEYYDAGYYYYTNLLDLGEIYTVRLQSLIEAEGFDDDDLMSSWIPLSSVALLQSSTVSDWDVISQYRATDEFIVMSTWTTLTGVAALDSGSTDVWTDWKAFTVGDFTGRIFQFRLKLISNKASVSPRVYDGIIRADMPDRIESYQDITVPVTGYNITYSPSFAGPGSSPTIGVTIDDAQTGDYHRVTSKTLDGFTLKIYDNTDTLVERQCDIIVKGYGRKNASVI
jgi:hypothetical protein